MIIYKATNLINGKVYIGQTIHSLERRKQRHLQLAKKGQKTHFYSAIRKYGPDNFKFEVICHASSKQELNELENYYINKYDAVHSGYNMVDGGNNNIMFIDSVKEKHLARMQSAEVRNKLSQSMKQYRREHPFSAEHRRKLSERAMGNHNFTDTRTRCVSCYCIVNGYRYDFDCYLNAGKWWYENYAPFPYSACIYQRKIKQSIQLGYCTYGRGSSQIIIDNIRWYRK